MLRDYRAIVSDGAGTKFARSVHACRSCLFGASAVPRRAAERLGLCQSYEVQWTNFASWLIAGGLVFAGVALLWAAVDVLRSSADRRRAGAVYLLLLLASFVLGFINALVHAKDAWAAMPTGLVLSAWCCCSRRWPA